jgi:hypothetical protein
MASASDFQTKSIRIYNDNSKKAYWLSASDSGAMVMSEINSDVTRVPILLRDPVALPAVPVFTTGVSTTTTMQFDGLLGAGSTVALNQGSGTVASPSVSGSTMTFQYTAAANDVLRFVVKSGDGSKTARRVFTPETITLGPTYVENSLTQTLFTHGWVASTTATFNREIGSVIVDIVDNAGASAGTFAKSISGSTVSLTNIVISSGATKIRFSSVTDTEMNVTALIEVPITTQSASTPTLSSVSLSSFVYGVATQITVSFNETLQSFAPTINGSGSSITTTWLAGQSTAQCTVTASVDSTLLSFSVVDNNDGGADTITHGITVSAPVQPELTSLSVSSFIKSQAQTGILATFDRNLGSIASISLSTGGGVSNVVLAGQTITFDLTPTNAAQTAYLFFNGVVSNQNSQPVNRSWTVTVTAPVTDPWTTNIFSTGARTNIMDVDSTFANIYHFEQTILATYTQTYTRLNFNVNSWYQWRFRDAYYTQNNTNPIPVVTGMKIYWEAGGNVDSIWRFSGGNANGGEVVLANNVALNSSNPIPTVEWSNSTAYEYIRMTLLGGAFWKDNPALHEVDFKIPS